MLRIQRLRACAIGCAVLEAAAAENARLGSDVRPPHALGTHVLTGTSFETKLVPALKTDKSADVRLQQGDIQQGDTECQHPRAGQPLRPLRAELPGRRS